MLQPNSRNKAKLQAYQREYAQQKRAPGRRKISKTERQLLEEQYVKTQALMEMEGTSKNLNNAPSQCVPSSPAI